MISTHTTKEILLKIPETSVLNVASYLEQRWVSVTELQKKIDEIEKMGNKEGDNYPNISPYIKNIITIAFRAFKLALLSEIGSVDSQKSGTSKEDSNLMDAHESVTPVSSAPNVGENSKGFSSTHNQKEYAKVIDACKKYEQEYHQ